MISSYLEFLDNSSPENVKTVHEKCGMTQAEACKVAGVSLQTYKGWSSNVNKRNYRKPHNTSWNLFLYELEARRLGFVNLQELISS